MKLRLLDRNDVRNSLTMERAIELMAGAFQALSAQRIESPLRTVLSNENGTVLYKPAYSAAHGMFCTKVVSVFPKNAESGQEVTPGLILVNSADTGLPIALMDAGYLTSLRTGAATGLATRFLASPQATMAALFGTGGQAAHQLEAMLAVRPLSTVFVYSRSLANAERFGQNHQASAEGCQLVATDDHRNLHACQVITTATTSPKPLFADDELSSTAHINAIGSLGPDRSEIPLATMQRARLFVDQREACLEEAGEIQLLRRATQPHAEIRLTEIGELVDRDPAHEYVNELSVFKSVGNAAQDIVCAAEIIQHAQKHGVGRMVEL